MEKVSILTSHQQQILDKISKSKFIASNFYFTGGTVLAKNFQSLPKMIKPLKLEELKDFFTQKAVELAKKVVE